jgi:general stress protein YciG
VKAKYGSEFYEEIGRKGGEATKSKYGPSFYEVIGQKGGQRPKRKTAAS